MVTLATLTGNVHDLVGADFSPRKTKVYVKANIDRIVDTDTPAVRLGTATYKRADDVSAGLDRYGVEDDGSFSFSLIATGSTGIGNIDDPDDLQYTVYVDYGRASDRTRRVETFGPYAVGSDADISELEEAQGIEPTWQNNLDNAAAELIADSGSDVAAALSASIDQRVADSLSDAATVIGAASVSLFPRIVDAGDVDNFATYLNTILPPGTAYTFMVRPFDIIEGVTA